MLLQRRNPYLFWAIMAAGIILAFFALLFLTSGAASADSGMWQASYWNNLSLSGQPTLVRQEPAIDYNWKGLSPDVSINVDNFSAQWVRTVQFAPGTYRFKATMDDGMRVWVDNKLIIDDWQEGKVRTNEADVMLSGGPHNITVEYFEKGGVAIAGFTWGVVTEGQPMPPYPEHPIEPMPPMPMPPGGQPGMPMPPGGQPGMPMPNEPLGIVRTSFLNVRQGPGASFAPIAVIPNGTEVRLIARNANNTWLEVMNPMGARGWVNAYYIETKYPIQNLPIATAGGDMGHTQEPMGKVNVANLNVRYGPGTNFGVFAIVHQGNTVAVLARDNSGAWIKVRIPTGAEGWVNAKYISGDFSINHLPVA